MNSEIINPNFSLTKHLLMMATISFVVTFVGLFLYWGASPLVWLAMPLFWILANFIEWVIHKYFMHRPLIPKIIYKNHAVIHHKIFDGEQQEIKNIKELSIVMMPWYTLLMIVGVATPIALTLGFLLGQSYAGVFLVSTVIYFVSYELIHTLHHLSMNTLSKWKIDKFKPYLFLRRHHHLHHNLKQMRHINFNVTFPLADLVLGTYRNM